MATASRELLNTRHSTIREVDLDEITIDPRAQRHVRPTRVEAIVENFHPAGVGTPTVARFVETGKLVTVDGQTRIVALRQLRANGAYQATTVRCEVFEEPSLTLEEIAELFLLRNNSSRIAKGDRQRIDYVSGNDAIHEAHRQAVEANFTVYDEHGLSTITDADAAVFVVKHGLKADNLGLLTDTLRILGDAYGFERGAVDPRILKALGKVLQRFDDKIDRKVLSERLKKAPTSVIMQDASDLAPYGNLTTRTCMALIGIYNKGVSQQKRLAWR